MGFKKVSGLPEATTIGNDDKFMLASGGQSYGLKYSQLASDIGSKITPTLTTLTETITSNTTTTYSPSTYGVQYFDGVSITTNVPSVTPTSEDLTVDENGTYTPESQSVEYFKNVTVNVEETDSLGYDYGCPIQFEVSGTSETSPIKITKNIILFTSHETNMNILFPGNTTYTSFGDYSIYCCNTVYMPTITTTGLYQSTWTDFHEIRIPKGTKLYGQALNQTQNYIQILNKNETEAYTPIGSLVIIDAFPKTITTSKIQMEFKKLYTDDDYGILVCKFTNISSTDSDIIRIQIPKQKFAYIREGSSSESTFSVGRSGSITLKQGNSSTRTFPSLEIYSIKKKLSDYYKDVLRLDTSNGLTCDTLDMRYEEVSFYTT